MQEHPSLEIPIQATLRLAFGAMRLLGDRLSPTVLASATEILFNQPGAVQPGFIVRQILIYVIWNHKILKKITKTSRVTEKRDS